MGVGAPIKLRYKEQANSVYFDRLQLIRDNANTYTYDSEGNMTSVAANAEQQSSMKYSGSDLTSVTDIAGYGYTYTYDNNHNLKSAKSAGDVTTKFVYNDNNQVEYLKVENGNGQRVLLEKIIYTEEDGSIQAGAHIAAVADTNADETRYTYDHRERLRTVTTTAGHVTTYSYQSDTDDRLKYVIAPDSSYVTYTYDGNRLDSLTYGSDTYTFEVDQFGNARSTSINDKLLSVNTYADRNGKLKRSPIAPVTCAPIPTTGWDRPLPSVTATMRCTATPMTSTVR